jgi:uncharacterized protein with HEPN domain
MRSVRQRLQDILDSISSIERHTSSGEETFRQDELVQVWTVYHLQITGEAVNHLPEQMLSSHSDYPWSNIVGMRNVLVHGYFGINLTMVWGTVETDLPQLKQKVTEILETLDD